MNKNLRALDSLGEPSKHWDTLLIHIMTHNLDCKTYREWEEHKGQLDKRSQITFDQFLNFIKIRADLNETLEMSSSTVHNNMNTAPKSNSKIKTLLSMSDHIGQRNNNVPGLGKLCPKCNGEHRLNVCPQFLALSTNERLLLLPSFKICFNCFSAGHYANHCRKTGCKVCHKKHNTLVHSADHKHKPAPTEYSSVNLDKPYEQSSQQSQSSNLTLSASVSAAPRGDQADVILSTALIKVYGNNNREYIARVIFDSGSTSSFITEKLYHRLELSANVIKSFVTGVGKSVAPISKICDLRLKSLNSDFSTSLKCFVLPTITDYVPSSPLNLSSLKLPSNIC